MNTLIEKSLLKMVDVYDVDIVFTVFYEDRPYSIYGDQLDLYD